MKFIRQPQKVIRNRIAYAVGDAGFNIYWEFASIFLLFFYTNVAHIGAAAAATILIVGRLIDIIAGPVVGFLADRTRSRFGRFRPYVLWASPLLAISFVLLFTAPSFWHSWGFPLSLQREVELGCLAATLFSALYSASNIPYTAMLTVITPDETERARTVGLRFTFAFLGAFFIQSTTWHLAAVLGRSDAATGWQRVATLDAALATMLLLACFWGTREVITPPRNSLRWTGRGWLVLFRDAQMYLLLSAIFLSLIAFECRGTASVYYVHSVLHRQTGVSLFLAANSVAGFGACILLTIMPQAGLQKRRISIACCLSGAACTFLLALVSADQWWLILLIQVVFGLSTGMLIPALFGMLADMPKQLASLRDQPVEGIFAAFAILSLKFGGLCGGGIVGVILAHLNYQPQPAQPQSIIHALTFLMSLLPAALLLLSGAALWAPGLWQADIT